MTYFNDYRKLASRGEQAREDLRNRASHQFFVYLGQFPGNNDLTVPDVVQ